MAAVEALKALKVRQAEERLAARSDWEDRGLVFTSKLGTPLDASHVRRAFKGICEDAGIGNEWTPRELRHTFVFDLERARRSHRRDCTACGPQHDGDDGIGLSAGTAPSD